MTDQSFPGQTDPSQPEKARPVTPDLLGEGPVARVIKKEPDANRKLNMRPYQPERVLVTGNDTKKQPESPNKANRRGMAHCAVASAAATDSLIHQAETTTLQPSHRDEAKASTGLASLRVDELRDAMGGASTRHGLRERKATKKTGGSKRDRQSSPSSDEESSSGSDSGSEDLVSDFGDSDSDDAHEDEDGRPKKATTKKQQAPSDNKPREKPARNPREFVARLHKAQDDGCASEQNKKRAGNAVVSGSKKKAKTGHQGREPGAIERLQNEAAMNVGDLNMTDAPAMPSFKASTHKEQWINIRKNIPPQADNRRTSTQREDLEEATKLFGFRKIQAVDGKWLYRKMSTSLYGYQMTAAAWMIKRELERFEPKGGVLADAMGMGKTLMALACVAGNPPEREDAKEFSKATLVVVPSKSVALNWVREVKKHCTKLLGDRVCIYDARDSKPLGSRQRNTVIITTYGVLRGQYPSDEFIKELEEKYQGRQSSLDRAMAKEVGFLFKQKWYRVILDEAHAIKNIEIRATRACCALKSKHNWALSGTPLANSAEEFYPYLKFVRCNFTDSQDDFRAKYMTDGKANDAFETLVSMVMYRRTMNDSFMGNAIIKLPESTGQVVWISLSREERLIQNTIAEKFEEEAVELENGPESVPNAKESEEEKEMAMNKLRLSTLTRLREVASHVFNLEKLLRVGMKTDKVQQLKAGLDGISPKVSVLDQLVYRDDGKQYLEGFETGVARLRELKEPVFGGIFDCSGLLERIENEKMMQDTACSRCHVKPPQEPVRFDPCGHCFCTRCFGHLLTSASHTGSRKDDFSRPELLCGHGGCGQRVDGRSCFPTLDCVDFQPARGGKNKASQEAGRDSNGVSVPRDSNENSLFITSALLPECPLPPSAKLTATMAVICTWQKESPDDKIIVFVQFIMTGKVLGRMLESAGISFLYLTGALTQKQKEKALEDFVEDPTKMILISTMRCGGQSLNLTVANRVIIIDPWWNTTAERQAYCRVLRIGQEKKSHLVHIMAHDSIDRRISKLQGSKDVEIDHALQDDGHVPAVLNDARLEELLDSQSCTKRKRRQTKAKGGTGGKAAATRRR